MPDSLKKWFMKKFMYMGPPPNSVIQISIMNLDSVLIIKFNSEF